MLKIPPPVWALVCVLFAVAISWWLDWPDILGFAVPPLGIALVAVPRILPVWAIVMFRRADTEIKPTSPTNRELITLGPYRFTRNPMYLGLVIRRSELAARPSQSSSRQTGSTSRMKRPRCGNIGQAPTHNGDAEGY